MLNPPVYPPIANKTIVQTRRDTHLNYTLKLTLKYKSMNIKVIFFLSIKLFNAMPKIRNTILLHCTILFVIKIKLF